MNFEPNATPKRLPKKPTKAPPPPPVPPRDHWPRLANSYAGSEYGGQESVHSLVLSTRSLQPHMIQHSPDISRHGSHQYMGNMYPCSEYSFYTCQETPHCSSHANSLRSMGARTPPRQIIYSPDPIHFAKHGQQPPIPKQRNSRSTISTGRLCVSPLPSSKKEIEKDKDRLNQLRCNPKSYNRHVEQHIWKLFEYLKQRERRRQKLEIELMNTPSRQAEDFKRILAFKETTHLRTLREPMGPNDFKVIKLLGMGFIGKVSLVEKLTKDGSPGQLYAMKKLKKYQVERHNQIAHVKAERDILAEADNEWIVRLFFTFQDRDYLYFILEYVPGGDFMGLLSRYDKFDEPEARFYMAEISLALQFVHDMNFVHRDIKPDNILIDANGHIKLADFGFCTGSRLYHDSNYYNDERQSGEISNTDANGLEYPTITTSMTRNQLEYDPRKKMYSLVGTADYMAPEILRSRDYRQAMIDRNEPIDENANEKLCDWWSVGVILYEMVVGFPPFIDRAVVRGERHIGPEDRYGTEQRILNWRDYLVFPREDKYIPLALRDTPVSQSTESLIRGLLTDREERLCQTGLQEIRDHPFFNGIDWENIRKTDGPHKPILDGRYDTRCFDEQNFQDTINRNDEIGEMLMSGFSYKNFWKK